MKSMVPTGLLLLAAGMALASCSSGPTMNPLQAAGCAVETTVTTAFGGVIVNQCAGTDVNACGQALLTALGNVNVCSKPIPATAGLMKSQGKWQKVGDVTEDDLKQGKMSMKAVQTQGVIGSVVCPLAYSTVIGLVSGVVPKACGCTKNLDAGALGDALIAACVAAVPI